MRLQRDIKGLILNKTPVLQNMIECSIYPMNEKNYYWYTYMTEA